MGIEFVHDPDKSYELTTDNVEKILAIHMRFRLIYFLFNMRTYEKQPCHATANVIFLNQLLFRYLYKLTNRPGFGGTFVARQRNWSIEEMLKSN